MRIDFLHQNIFGVGGTVRSVINLANALAPQHDVRIVSVFRRVDRPSLHIDPRVRVIDLVDMRPRGADRGNARHNRRSALVPAAEEYFHQYSELTDERLTEYLTSLDRDVVVGTRPSLNLLVAQIAPDGVLKVAQEHMTHSAIPQSVVREMRLSYGRLDLVTTVTAADRRRVEESLKLPPNRTAVLPNSVPQARTRPGDARSKTIVAAGRLAPEKRYDLLLHALARLKPDFPDWRLRLYGDGPLAANLAQLADDLGVRESVLFMGRTLDMDSEWVKGSFSVSTSERESFGMSIVESMRRGVPVVSTDCPDGPGEIIRHGVDGILVPTGDVTSLAGAMARLMSSPARRSSLGRAASRSSARYDPERVARSFAVMLERVRPGTLTRTRRPMSPRASLGRLRRRLKLPKNATVDVASLSPTSLLITSNDVGRWLSRATLHNGPSSSVSLRSIARRRTPKGIVIDTKSLTEGAWNLQLHIGAKRCIINPASIDTRALAEGRGHTRDSFRWAIPYRNMHDRLGLRVWSRERAANLDRMGVAGGVFDVRATLHGPWEADTLCWEVRRGDTYVTGGRLEAQGANRVRFSVPATELSTHRLHRLDQLQTYVVDGTGTRAPIAALASDIADLRRVMTPPSWLVDETIDTTHFRESGFTGAVRVSGQIGQLNALTFRVEELG